MNRYKVTFSDDTIMRLYANTRQSVIGKDIGRIL